ncbi:uncharacterized protein LOC144761298 isoform X2 [Lissotriton helveticus]
MSQHGIAEQEACHEADQFETVLPITTLLLSDEEHLPTDEDDGGHHNINTAESEPIQSACSLQTTTSAIILERHPGSRETPHERKTDPHIKLNMETQEKTASSEKHKLNRIERKSNESLCIPVVPTESFCSVIQASGYDEDADFFETVLPVTIIGLSDEDFLTTDKESVTHRNTNTLGESGPVHTACSCESCASNTTFERTTCSQDTPHQGTSNPTLKLYLESQEKLDLVPLTSMPGNQGNGLYDVTSRKGELDEKRKLTRNESKPSETRGTPVRRSRRACKGTQGSVNIEGICAVKPVKNTGCKLRNGKAREASYYLRSCSKPGEHHPTLEANQRFKCSLGLFPNVSCLGIGDLQENTASELQLQSEDSPRPPRPSVNTTKTTGLKHRSEDTSPSMEKVKEPDKKCQLPSKIAKVNSKYSSVLTIKRLKCQKCSLTFRSARLLNMHIKSDHRHGIDLTWDLRPQQNTYLALLTHNLRTHQRKSSLKK